MGLWGDLRSPTRDTGIVRRLGEPLLGFGCSCIHEPGGEYNTTSVHIDTTLVR